ncbi:TPA: hypothetical protein ACUSTA_001246 [Escherichia coli]
MNKLTYLFFPDEKTAKITTGFWDKKAGCWAEPAKSLQFSVRGALYNADGEYAEDGSVIKEPTIRPGFYIDVIYGDIPQPARQYRVTPSTPEYVLA